MFRCPFLAMWEIILNRECAYKLEPILSDFSGNKNSLYPRGKPMSTLRGLNLLAVQYRYEKMAISTHSIYLFKLGEC